MPIAVPGHPSIRSRVPPRVHVDWDDVSGAEVQTTRKGRSVIRLYVAGAATPAHQRDDSHAIKVAAEADHDGPSAGRADQRRGRRASSMVTGSIAIARGGPTTAIEAPRARVIRARLLGPSSDPSDDAKTLPVLSRVYLAVVALPSRRRQRLCSCFAMEVPEIRGVGSGLCGATGGGQLFDVLADLGALRPGSRWCVREAGVVVGRPKLHVPTFAS